MSPHAGPGGPGDALIELRGLLFGSESRRLEALEGELRDVAARALARDDLKDAAAAILADALRKAEVERHRDMADALAPLVVGAMRAEIRNSKDSMVEALYPLMGRLVSAAVGNAFRQLTETLAKRIEALTSARQWAWRAKALVTGRSVAEVAMADLQEASIRRILCLERGSGALLAVWPAEEATPERAGLVAGLIAAITEFAASALGEEGELRSLDLGPESVVLRRSATVIVAAQYSGILSGSQRAALDSAFLALIEARESGQALSLEPIAEAAASPAQTGRASGRGAVALTFIAFFVGLALLVFLADKMIDWRFESRAADRFAAWRADAADLAAWPLRLGVDHAARIVRLEGLAPEKAARDRIEADLGQAFRPYILKTDIAVVRADGEGAQR